MRVSMRVHVCVCVGGSRHHAHISACMDLKAHIHSNTGKVFAGFPIHAVFPHEHNYAK